MALGSDRARETVRRLRDDIAAGRWPVNGKIPNEADLAAELGVGRSTVREAVRSLAHLGMLEPAPGRGTFVRSLNPVHGAVSQLAADHSWRDLLEVRHGLEVEAARLAAARADSAGRARLRAAHEADLAHDVSAERGRLPGQFHAVLVEIGGNKLLSELHSGVLAALRRGMGEGAVRFEADEERRHADHAALLAAVEAGDVAEAGRVADLHARDDLIELARR